MAARKTVPMRVYWLSFLRPASPSFFSWSRVGETLVKSCMMIEAEMNMSNMPSTPPPCCWKICASTMGSMPGSGM